MNGNNNHIVMKTQLYNLSHKEDSDYHLLTSEEGSSFFVKKDGRSTRRTNRTLPFSTKVTPEFDMQIRKIAERKNIRIVEVLELALISLMNDEESN